MGSCKGALFEDISDEFYDVDVWQSSQHLFNDHHNSRPMEPFASHFLYQFCLCPFDVFKRRNSHFFDSAQTLLSFSQYHSCWYCAIQVSVSRTLTPAR